MIVLQKDILRTKQQRVEEINDKAGDVSEDSISHTLNKTAKKNKTAIKILTIHWLIIFDILSAKFNSNNKSLFDTYSFMSLNSSSAFLKESCISIELIGLRKN